MNMRYDKTDLQEALRVLRAGGIIVYPTDTVWGIGCDATNAEAVAKIYALKQREDSKSMLVLLDSAAKLDYYVDVPESAEMLLDSVCEKGIPSGKEDSTSQSDCSHAKPYPFLRPCVNSYGILLFLHPLTSADIRQRISFMR